MRVLYPVPSSLSARAATPELSQTSASEYMVKSVSGRNRVGLMPNQIEPRG